MMRPLLLAALVLGALPGIARAQNEERLPAGKFGVSVGVRQGLGQLNDDYGAGVVGAMEAAYHPSALPSQLSLGLAWSVAWGWFGFDDQASVTGSLRLLELNFGIRLRRPISEVVPRFLVAGSGATFLRSNVPIPPDLERIYIGPYVTLGLEQFLSNSTILSFEARYGLIATGPGGISLVLGIAFGR